MKKDNSVKFTKVSGGFGGDVYRVESGEKGLKISSKNPNETTAVLRVNTPGGGYKDILSVKEK